MKNDFTNFFIAHFLCILEHRGRLSHGPISHHILKYISIDFSTSSSTFFQASAHENVNVDAAFFAVAQLVDRSRGRTRILSYYEAAMGRRQMMDEATVKFREIVNIELVIV